VLEIGVAPPDVNVWIEICPSGVQHLRASDRDACN
jgi:hypothetical protein